MRTLPTLHTVHTREMDGWTGGRTDRHTYRQSDIHTDSQTDRYIG